jgi:septum formation protein
MKIILASNSPRRKELLSGLGYDFQVEIIKGIKENYPQELPTEEVPKYIACEKASAYNVAEGELLITADTIVALDGEIMGKPHDAAEAHRMLRKLSGHTHHVVTGVCLTTTHKQVKFSEVTAVTFRELTDAEIDYYISHYQPFDKAGAYGIQEWIGYVGVTGINGSFYNVMGLPVERVYEEISKMLK